MARDAVGVWTLSLGPVPRGLWSYNFKVDGDYIIDPRNPDLKFSRERSASVIDLPGGFTWDRHPGVPHGVVHLHDYQSDSLGRTRRLRVYTPPTYESDDSSTYPVLYLLHGSGDNESSWTEFGRANVILDNLIAAGTVAPMVVVMPDGHAVSGYTADSRSKNIDAFSNELLNQVMPMIGAAYRIRRGRDGCAIAGLSMGANQAITIGLRHPELFGAVGGMSTAIRDPHSELDDVLVRKATATSRPATSHSADTQLVWMSVGVDDRFLTDNHALHAALLQAGITHDYFETAGGHTWPVWRANLMSFAPRLFQNKR